MDEKPSAAEQAFEEWWDDPLGALSQKKDMARLAYLAATERTARRAISRSAQSACVCALILDNNPERISRRGDFGIEANRHLSDCPHAITHDIAKEFGLD